MVFLLGLVGLLGLLGVSRFPLESLHLFLELQVLSFDCVYFKAEAMEFCFEVLVIVLFLLRGEVLVLESKKCTI